jgi:hypothetical protein
MEGLRKTWDAAAGGLKASLMTPSTIANRNHWLFCRQPKPNRVILIIAWGVAGPFQGRRPRKRRGHYGEESKEGQEAKKAKKTRAKK